MYLIGSAKTGDKIMNNITDFYFTYTNTEKRSPNKTIYQFNWQFSNQKQEGYISIEINNNQISNNSLINTNKNSSYPFKRPLGLYNDPSLKKVFELMLNSI